MNRSIPCVMLAVLLAATSAVLAQGDPVALMLFGQGTYKSRAAVHGGGLYLWDDDFAKKLFSEIPTYKNITFMFDECYAGGFLNDLAFVNGQAYPINPGNERDNLSVACASRWDKYSVFEAPTTPGPAPSGTFLESYFSVGWIRAINQPHPSYDEFKDAFNDAAARLNNKSSKPPSYPQYYSNGPLAMDTLTLAKQPGDDKRYAIIFGAGADEAHYNSAKGIYDVLKSEYGYADNDIALLWCDGTHQFKGYNGTGSTWGSIDASATRANLWSVLEDMGALGGTFDKVGSDDRLLVCFVGHGGTDVSNSHTVITSTLENFEVKNLSGDTADDFHVVITGVQPSDIAGYYLGSKGWGSGTATSLSSSGGQPRTEVTWTGSAGSGQWVHFGIQWNGSALATNYEAWWTKNGMQLTSLELSKAPTWWQPQADFDTRALIVNLSDVPLTLTNLEWAIVDGHVELNDLMWDFKPEGGWIPYEKGYSPVLEPMSERNPTDGHLEIRFDGRSFAKRRAYSILLRYGVRQPGDEEAKWLNIVACHVKPLDARAREVRQVSERR